MYIISLGQSKPKSYFSHSGVVGKPTHIHLRALLESLRRQHGIFVGPQRSRSRALTDVLISHRKPAADLIQSHLRAAVVDMKGGEGVRTPLRFRLHPPRRCKTQGNILKFCHNFIPYLWFHPPQEKLHPPENLD